MNYVVIYFFFKIQEISYGFSIDNSVYNIEYDLISFLFCGNNVKNFNNQFFCDNSHSVHGVFYVFNPNENKKNAYYT